MYLKKLGIFNKIIFGANLIAALLLLVSFVLPYLPPTTFPTLSILSLGVSPLLLINTLFMLFWIIKFKKMALVSFLVLLIAYFHFDPFFEISREADGDQYSNTLSVLSYNVRLFNAYEKEPSKGVKKAISELLNTQQTDIVCIQEYYRASNFDFSMYPYQYIHFKDSNNKLGHAIFSKYPFAKTGAFDFENSNNNTLFADIIKGTDTIRIYNLHLQSMGIIPRVEFFQEENTDKLRARMTRAFLMQEQQVNEILEHKEVSPFPVLMTGDFNNTPFSYVYRELHKNMSDAFSERGSGIGTTYKFDGYPMRIDYILASQEFDVLNFNTVNKSFSDHFPIIATLGWSSFAKKYKIK